MMRPAMCSGLTMLVVLATLVGPSGAAIAAGSASGNDSSATCEPGGPVTFRAAPGSNAVVFDALCGKTPLTMTTDRINNRTIAATNRGIQVVASYPDVDTLDLTGNAITSITDQSNDSPSLKKLILSSNGITSLKKITIPSSVIDLDLSNNKLPSASGLEKTSLKRLTMTNASISDLSLIEFPSSLEYLSVAYNSISKVPKLSMTAIKTLTLTTNSISSFKDVSLPSTLQSLDVSWNLLSSFEGLTLPESVTKLYFGGNKFTSLKELKLTNPVTILYLHDLPLQNIDGYTFPDSVTALSLMNCSFKAPPDVKLPSKLAYYDLSKNDISTLPKKLPDSMLGLTVMEAKFTELKNYSFPKSIKRLNFNYNQISSIAGVSFPWNLEELVFGSVPITEFEVSRSDLALLQKVQTMNLTLSQSDCKNPAAEKVSWSKSTLCVLPDEVFNKIYRGNVGNAALSDKSANGWVLPVVICVAAVLAIALAVVGYRSRKAKTMNHTKAPDYPHSLADSNFLAQFPDPSNPFNNNSNNGVVSGTHLSTFQTMFSGSGQNTVNSNGSGSGETNLVKYRIPTHEIIVQRALAKGGFGIVYLATYQMQHVVVKKILPEKASDDRCLSAFLEEIKLCSTLNHPKIVRFLGVSWNTLSDIAVVMEYMGGGDLDTLLKQQLVRKRTHPDEFGWYQSFNLPCKSALALDILEAIVYLHSFSSPIIHRDLKAKNVLLSNNYEAKLSDFGVSKEWRVDQTMTAGIGTMAWIAPEVLRGERYTEKADMYSFGVILTELATCAKPFEGVTNALIVLKVTSGEQRPEMGDECPEDIRELGNRCLSYNPSERPSAMVAHYELKTLLKAESAFEL